MIDLDRIAQEVRDQIAAMKGLAPGALGLEDSLIQSGVIDSLGMMDLVAWLEQRYRVTLNDEDLDPDSFESSRAIAQAMIDKGATPPS